MRWQRVGWSFPSDDSPIGDDAPDDLHRPTAATATVPPRSASETQYASDAQPSDVLAGRVQADGWRSGDPVTNASRRTDRDGLPHVGTTCR